MKDLFDKLFSGGFASTYFTDPFKGFSWWDALDILALALIFFALYLFVRDRRAGKLMAGIVLLFGIYALSELLNMHALQYIFGSFFGYGIVALAIVFQPEIRAAMERIGSVPFRGLKTIGVEHRSMALSSANVDAVVEAVKDMSFSKTGALIVIERTTRIGEYIRTGTTLNAELTPELLRAVFFDKAPLHDGAVIVRGGRVYAAGCYLPLSEKTDIFKGLGTRHRAAIGLSEQSDSVIIVVSEETGTISIAYKGELFREFTSVSLRRKLFELLGKQEDAAV
ncbi:MAG: diadenylate cyclase CdaA [Clostridia bacterium]|nr:diadenylate cyclase CdaA [Clostridia bacterium]